MSTKTTTLAIKIVSDSKSAGAGFDAAETRMDRFNQRLDQASRIATGVVAGIGAIGVASYKAASDLEQSSGAVESVFTDQATAVEEYASRAAQAVGLSRNSYNELGAVIGSQLTNMGIAHDQLAPKTNSLVELGADLAATYGGPTSDAVSALSSLLRGETDPIERYGVSIKQSDINARLAAQGQDELTGAAAKAAQAQAVLGLLSEQTGAAVGAFGREGDTAAGQTQRAAAEFENAKAALGDALLPIVSEGAQKLSELSTVIAEHKDVVLPLAGIFLGVAAAIWLVNFAMAANPFTLAAIAIGALIGIVVLLWNKFEGFRNFIAGVGSFLSTVFNGARDVLGWIVDKLSWLLDAVGFGWLADAFSAPAVVGPQAAQGTYGAAGGSGAGGIRGASLGGLGAFSSSSSSGGASVAATTVNVTINGAVDPVASGRQLVSILREYGVATGGQVTVVLGRQ